MVQKSLDYPAQIRGAYIDIMDEIHGTAAGEFIHGRSRDEDEADVGHCLDVF